MDVVCLVDMTGWKSKGNLELEGQSHDSLSLTYTLITNKELPTLYLFLSKEILTL